MSNDLFWYGNAEDYWAYRFAYLNKLELEREVFNQNAWLQGAYFFDALSKALSNSNRSKDSQPIQHYIEKPIDFKQEKINQNKEEAQNKLEIGLQVLLSNYKAQLDTKENVKHTKRKKRK